MVNSNFEHRELSTFQQRYISEVRALPLEQPFKPWNLIWSIQLEQIICIGWTKENFILVVSYDRYWVLDPLRKIEVLNAEFSLSHNLLNGNVVFKVSEFDELVNVFGIYGGEGNHVTSDGWKLGLIYPYWPNAVVFMRSPSSGGNIWYDMKLIKLIEMEYNDLRCGFSLNENLFLISNTSGLNVFARNEM